MLHLKKQNFIQGSLILIASAAIAKVIGAIFRIPLANLLGGTGMGYFSSAYGIFMTIYAVSVTGLPIAVAKLTAECSALCKYGHMKKIKNTALLIFSLTGLAFTLLMLLLAYPFCLYVSKSPEAVLSVAAIAPSILFGCITAVFRGYYEGRRNMYPTAISQIIEAVVKLVSGLALCVAVLDTAESLPLVFSDLTDIIRRIFPFDSVQSLTDEEMVMPLAAAAAVSGVTISSFAAMVYVILRDKLAGGRLKIHEDNCNSHGMESFGSISAQLFAIVIPVAVGSLITNLTSLIDLATIIGSLSRAVSSAPQYFARYVTEEISADALPNFFFGSFSGLAVTIFNLIPSFTNMFGKGAVPSIAEAFAQKDSLKIRRSVMNVIFTSAYISVPSGIGITVLAPHILNLLFPTRAAETALCVLPLRFLGIGVIFLSISSVLFSVLQAAGKSKIPVKIMLVGVTVKLVGNLLLVSIPQINVTGAAISTLLCYGVILIMSIHETRKYTFIKTKEVYGMLFKMTYCGILCGGTAFFAQNAFTNISNSSLLVAVSVSIGAIIYIISTHLSGILTKTTLKLLIC